MENKSKESKKIARYSLIIMAIGFTATIPFQGSFWVDLIQGGFEAGLVGGLADWFAVTALFRHPLGLRIPHTALLPNNRERMTNGLVRTLKNDWLSKESIQEKIKQVQFSDKLLVILEKEIRTEHFRKAVINLLKKIVASIEVEKISPFVKKQIVSAISDLDLSKYIQLLSKQLLKEQIDQKVLDHVLKKAENWLRQEGTGYRLGTVAMNMLNKIEVEGILQFAINSMRNLLNEEKLGNIVKKLLLSGIHSLQKAEDQNRVALILYIRNEIQGINDNQELIDGIDKWKNQLLDNWEPDETITNTLKQIQQKGLEFVETEDFFDIYLMPIINRIVENLEERKESIDQWIQNQITILVEKNHEQIGNLVQENLDKLDNETLIDMVENNIAKDIQWIRVNGAVCGFVIGLILTCIQALFRLA
jgi:uncharacterized membrane-anchored protein YjiN (DUF445 family)